MKLYRAIKRHVDDSGSTYASTPGALSHEAVLRRFEPENPNVAVPRLFGLGWDINFGAVAAKLGMIRPDDSLPDLEAFVPKSMRVLLKAGPWVGLAATVGVATALLKQERVTSNWSLTGKPRSYTSGKALAAILLATSGVPMTLLQVRKVREGEPSNEQSSRKSASLVVAAQTMGLQTMAVLGGVAALREIDRPGEAQPLAVAAVFAAPLVTGSLLIVTTKTALRSLGDALRVENKQDGSDEL